MRRTTTWNGLHPRLCLNSSRKHVLYPLHIVMLQEVRDRELFEIRGSPRQCTAPVQPDQSGSRAPPSRCDRCYTPSFLVHAAYFIVLRHDVLQLRASDVSSRSPAMNTTSHTSLLPSKVLPLHEEQHRLSPHCWHSFRTYFQSGCPYHQGRSQSHQENQNSKKRLVPEVSKHFVPSLTRAMRKAGKLQNWVVDTCTRQNQKSS